MTTYSALAAYAPLSRNPNGELTSVAEQFQILEARAARDGSRITARFSDDDLSAWDTTVNRPGWQGYLKALRSGDHDGAASYHLDRLSRNGRDSEALITVCTDTGLDLVTPETTLRLGTSADDQAMFRVWSAMSIHQSSATSRRERGHKDLARAHGNLRYVLGGNPPVGFRDGENDWETDDAHAALLREIVRRLLAGSDLAPAYRAATKTAPAPLTNVAANARGTKRGAVVISEKMIRAALRRASTYGLMTDRDGKIMGPAAITDPPLDPALYDRVRMIFKHREGGGLLPADRFPLGPVLFCGKCGNQMSGGQNYYRGTKTAVYVCKNRHKLPGGSYNVPCKGVSANAAQVHDEVAAALTAWAETSPRYAEASGQDGQFDEQAADLEGQLSRTRRQVMGIKRDKLQDPAFRLQAEAEYDELIEAGNAVVADLVARLDEVRAAQAEPALPATMVWDDLTPEGKRQLVRTAWGKITVTRGKGGPKPLPMADRLTFVG